MKQIIDQFVRLLEQGIAAIFRFVQLVWTWSSDQITRMLQAPFANWPLWKQILLVIVIALVAFFLFIAARRLWFAAMRVFAAFVHFLGALVYTLPAILIAGCIALAGLWTINNFNPSSLPTVTWFQNGTTGSASPGNEKPAGQPSAPETTGSRQ
jgi:hypothetical protein